MQASPSTHFVSFAQSILYRGAGIDVVWPQFLAVAGIGGLFFGLAICASGREVPRGETYRVEAARTSRPGAADAA
jgi:hypothetical protein